MKIYINLLIIELIPMILWIYGAICEEKSTKYPDVRIGYKSKISIKNKITWEYANKLVARINGAMGTFLFIINAIVVLVIGQLAFVSMLIVDLIAIIVVRVIIDTLMKKKFNEDGQFKNN